MAAFNGNGAGQRVYLPGQFTQTTVSALTVVNNASIIQDVAMDTVQSQLLDVLNILKTSTVNGSPIASIAELADRVRNYLAPIVREFIDSELHLFMKPFSVENLNHVNCFRLLFACLQASLAELAPKADILVYWCVGDHHNRARDDILLWNLQKKLHANVISNDRFRDMYQHENVQVSYKVCRVHLIDPMEIDFQKQIQWFCQMAFTMTENPNQVDQIHTTEGLSRTDIDPLFSITKRNSIQHGFVFQNGQAHFIELFSRATEKCRA